MRRVPRLLTILLVLLGIGWTANALAQTESNFFSSTQSSGKLASGASGCPTGATCVANQPGFNPTDLVKRANPAATTTFTGVTPTGPAPSVFFSQLGPGAITDNMFGVVSTTLSTNSTLCGNLPGDPNTGAGVLPNAVGPNGSSLNCGDLRFDPTSQGQTIPAFPAANNITLGNPTTVGRFNSDLLPSTSDHLGLDMINDFTFVLSPESTSATQQTKQVTALTADATLTGCPGAPDATNRPVGCPGTLASPGSGDQLLDIDISPAWSLTGTFNSTTNRPTITWSMTLDDLDPLTPSSLIAAQTDSINTMGTLATDSSFVYNDGTFPQTTIPAPCWWSGCTTPAATITIP